ncbi:cysteine synthase A [Alphaproteobacteria bacterium]|jgi:cysteine synthase A|nr:cysteine synthase A [Alphaproteobacteria bacterium]|tara:strand:- start:2312 stop:3316 length:1005 start_codon:yes stop_codon:yes gene_type:complete
MNNYVKENFIDTIGNTPLIKLKKASEITGCHIYGKAEFLNPGSSIKDRAAKGIILDAISNKKLLPGGIIVEGTAGNTGIGLGLVGNSLGYKTLIVMPETQSQEKKDALKLIGCELRLVPALPYSNPGNYIRQSETIAMELNKTHNEGVLWANQFDNIANKLSHYNSTGPEIWDQTEGKIDGFTCAVGTGGTLSGTGLFLKEKNKDIKIALSDPFGSGLYNYYKNGKMKSEGNSITEGIGQGRITKNLEDCPIDMSFRIDDNQALKIIFALLKEEGLFLGGSSGINIAGAVKLAKELGPGKTIVTILCDSGQRYQSKIWNPTFLESKNLIKPYWL